MKVVFPRPDSPATMIVKAAPRFATILWRWLGSYMLLASDKARAIAQFVIRTLAMPIGDMVSAILDVGGVSATTSGVFLEAGSV